MRIILSFIQGLIYFISSADPLAIAIKITAQHIESDWQRLYRSLPFYPPRGKQNIDEDIVKTIHAHDRNTEEVRMLTISHRFIHFNAAHVQLSLRVKI